MEQCRPGRLACVVGALLALAAAGSDEPATAIVGAALIDGTGTPRVDNAVVLVRGERIVAAGAAADVQVPADATVVDAAEKFLIPGLIDLHNHYGGGREGLERLFALQLEFGVTTARSLGADGAENLTVIADAKAGRIPAPRLYTAGAGFSHPQGMPPGEVIQRPTTEEEARQMVRDLAAADVDLIKMWVDATLDGRLAWSFDWNDGTAPIPKISAEIRTALVQEATRHGLPAVAHIYDEEDVRQLNAVGMRHFVHTVRRAPVDAEFARWARRQAVSFAPALAKAQDSWFMAEHPEVLDDPTLLRAWGQERIDRMKLAQIRADMLANPQDAQLRTVYGRMQRFVGQMQEADVTIAVGSDSGAGNVSFRLGHAPRTRPPGGSGPHPAAGDPGRHGERRLGAGRRQRDVRHDRGRPGGRPRPPVSGSERGRREFA